MEIVNIIPNGSRMQVRLLGTGTGNAVWIYSGKVTLQQKKKECQKKMKKRNQGKKYCSINYKL